MQNMRKARRPSITCIYYFRHTEWYEPRALQAVWFRKMISKACNAWPE
jgi:hypothetical protein